MKPYTYKFPCTKSLPIWGDLEGYCGKERDEETGLYYYGMRYYAAWLCRFVSVDPLQFEYPELTPYQYASNRPITGIDLDGLEFVNPHEAKLNEANTKVETAQAEYDALVEKHEGELTKADMKKYNNLSGLQKAQNSKNEQEQIFKKIDSYLNTLELTNKELYDYFSNLTDIDGDRIKIEVKLVDTTDGDRLATVKGMSTKIDPNNDCKIFPTATDNTLTILLFKRSAKSDANVAPGDQTGHNYASFANELGDIKFFFDNVKDSESLQYFQETTDPKLPGYMDEKGAGQQSFKFEKKRVEDVKKFIDKHPELERKYNSVTNLIRR